MISIINIIEGWDYEPLTVVTYTIDNKEKKLIIPDRIVKNFKTFPDFFRFIKASIEARENIK